MTNWSFSLAPEALVRLHDALTCLSRFSDTVAIEAEYDQLRLSTLNSSKTAYTAFVFDADSFFESYSFSLEANAVTCRIPRSNNKFSCQLYIKALLSVFNGKPGGRDKDTAVERCELELQEDIDETECRLIIKMICGLGVIKSYRLTYESITVQHAIFDRTLTTNQWSVDPNFLKEITDHFSPSAELLNIYSENTKVILTSFTTKITDGKEILRQPVHTSVAIDKKDFEHFLAEDNLHVAISLKDFKAVIAHAETMNVTIVARYTRPSRPLQFAYGVEGIKTEFTLMTMGEVGDDDASTFSRVVPQLSARQTPALARVSQANSDSSTKQMQMLPQRGRPIRPFTGTSSKGAESNTQATTASQLPPPSTKFDSLFVPMDDDRQWDVPNDDEAETEDMLGWDASADPDAFDNLGPRLRDNEPSLRQRSEKEKMSMDVEMGIPPTQRMSQIHGLGLFD